MEENLKVDKEYKEAFNLGYEMAKELNLKTPMFKDLTPSNSRISAMHSGMAQFIDEEVLPANKNIEKLVDQRKINPNQNMKGKSKNTGTGLIP